MRNRRIPSLLLLGLVSLLMVLPPHISAVPEVLAKSAGSFNLHDRMFHSVLPAQNTEPMPIPGGLQIPGGPFIHIFFPGPEAVNPNLFMGVNVEPSVIANYRGFAAIAYLGGKATGNDGKTYDLSVDMRAFQGEYVSADGVRRSGTFALI